MITLYGIKNCDTVRKAQAWLKQAEVSYHFHDVRDTPLSAATLEHWLHQVGEASLLNTRSTTWRQLPDADKGERTLARTLALLQEHPTLMKRPLVVHPNGIEIGFKESRYAELFL